MHFFLLRNSLQFVDFEYLDNIYQDKGTWLHTVIQSRKNKITHSLLAATAISMSGRLTNKLSLVLATKNKP